jgi:hypothetical protein
VQCSASIAASKLEGQDPECSSHTIISILDLVVLGAKKSGKKTGVSFSKGEQNDTGVEG